MPHHITAITGGIGAGKSVVSHILRALGHPVYDSDTHARHIIDTDPGIHRRLCHEIHPDAVLDGTVRRDIISATVFSDPAALARLNDIVHTRLVHHFLRWIQHNPAPRHFIETAILHQCPPLIPHITDIWHITAPDDIRIQRVCRRSNLTPDQVLARIQAQRTPAHTIAHLPLITIHNTPATPLLPQLHSHLCPQKYSVTLISPATCRDAPTTGQSL